MRLSVACLLALATSLAAQPPIGDIGVTGFSTNQIAVMGATGTATIYTAAAPFPSGTGAMTTQAILHDPLNPNDFIVGGVGLIGRATITGPASISYTPILVGTNFGCVGQMSWDAMGNIVYSDGCTDQVNIIDPATGAITPVTTGPQIWGTVLNTCIVRPSTGEIYAGGRTGLYRIPPGGGTPQLLLAGWWASWGSWISNLALDPFTSDIFATILGPANRVVRVNTQTGVFSDVVPAGTIQCPNSIDIDQAGDLVIGSTGQTLWRVPNAGGTPTLIGTVPAFGTGCTSGVSVVGGIQGGTPAPPTPFSFVVTSNGAGGGTATVTGVPSSAIRGMTLVSMNTTWAVGTGQFLGIVPDGMTFSLLGALPAPVPGNPVHWVAGVSGVFPAVPFTAGAGTFPVGATWDLVAVALDGASFPVAVSQVNRVTW